MDALDPVALLRRRDTAPAYWSTGILWLILADARSTGGSYTAIEQLCPKGPLAPMHVHHDQDEMFYVIEGNALFHLDNETYEGGPGELVSIPHGTPHGFDALTEGLRVLNWYTPAGFERLIVETGTPATALTLPPPDLPIPDPKRSERIMAEIGMSLCRPTRRMPVTQAQQES